jgi:hypothetical protein
MHAVCSELNILAMASCASLSSEMSSKNAAIDTQIHEELTRQQTHRRFFPQCIELVQTCRATGTDDERQNFSIYVPRVNKVENSWGTRD